MVMVATWRTLLSMLSFSCFILHFHALPLRLTTFGGARYSKVKSHQSDSELNFVGGVNPGRKNEDFNLQFSSVADVMTSLEVFSCQPGTQINVVRQCAQWAQGEFPSLNGYCTHSHIFTSVDGRRVLHMVGWKASGQLLTNVDVRFERFRERSAGAGGAPVGLTDSTHLYEAIFAIPRESASFHPPQKCHMSFDIYTCRLKTSMNEVAFLLVNAVRKMEEPVEALCHSLQVLRSLDGTVCCVMGRWETAAAYEAMLARPDYQQALDEVKKLAAEGTFSDITERTSPRRIFDVAESLFSERP